MFRGILKRAMVCMAAVVVATTAMMTTAFAAKETEIYLDNYTVTAIKSNEVIKMSETGTAKTQWYKLTLKSNTVVTIKGNATDYNATWYTPAITIYKAIDKTTADAKAVASLSTKECFEGKSVKLDKGTYFVKAKCDGLKRNPRFKFTWTEKAAVVKSLRVYIPLEVGDKLSLSSVVTTEDGSDVAVTYKSSDTKVAKVSSKGTITALAEGKFSVTIKAGDKSTKLYFKVTD